MRVGWLLSQAPHPAGLFVQPPVLKGDVKSIEDTEGS